MKVHLLFCLVLGVYAKPSPSNVVPGEYSVILKQGTFTAIKGLLQGVHMSASIPHGHKQLLTLRKVPESVAAALKASPLVEKIEKSTWVYTDAREAPTAVASGLPQKISANKKPACNIQTEPEGETNIWHLIRTSNTLPGRNLFEYGDIGTNAVVYILDTGVDIRHPDFDGRAVNGFVASNLENQGPDDENGHGTHCGSLASGTVYGSAKGSEVVNVKVLGRLGAGSTAGINEGIQWVVNNANQSRRNIISMSLGGPNFSAVQEGIIQEAVNAGIIVIAAAGNSNEDANGSFPAGYDNVISIGASDVDDNMATFSNWGPSVDTISPGVNNWAAGSNLSRACSSAPDPDNCYVSLSGTSMACPTAVGVVARIGVHGQENVRTWLHTVGALDDVITFNPGQESTPNRLVHLRNC